MKLENKHLSAYLPYGLKLIDTYGNILHLDGLFVDLAMHLLETNRIDYFHFYPQVKPILRPLSDLIIDGNLIEDFIGFGNLCNAYDEYIDHWYPDPSYAQQAPYVIFEYFLVNHYDVFGLIEAGLAVNINDI